MEEEEITEEETKQDITTLIEDNVTAMENKDVDEYMAMMDRDDNTADMYQETERTMKETFDLYELA
ncbi:MAG TPA: hypothetical protein VK119_10425 [Bacillota bacterium]|nr:hypothetical protein [Bacillota bacterium]